MSVVGEPQKGFTMTVKVTSPSSHMCDRIAKKLGWSVEGFWVVHDGRVVSGEWCVGTFGIGDESTVSVVRKTRRTPSAAYMDWRRKEAEADSKVLAALFLRLLQRKRPRRRRTVDGRSVPAVQASTVSSRA